MARQDSGGENECATSDIILFFELNLTIPEKMLMSIQSMINTFVWKNKPERIR